MARRKKSLTAKAMPVPGTQEVRQQPPPAEPKTSTFHYDDIPSVERLNAVLEKAPQVPEKWTELEEYKRHPADWLAELRQAARDVSVAANDATGIMCEIVNGKRKMDDQATKMIATVTAIRS